jgi:rhodanese-related sulfurtransferase
VQRLVEQGAQLIEVLPPSAYSREHLPGAVNIPLADLTGATIAREGLDPGRPTVVYCYDHECDLSARGAALLEALGFTDVHDYVDSKTAWLGEGLPAEGSIRASSRAGVIARTAARCRLDEQVGDLAGRFSQDDGVCVVVDEDDVVLGVVREEPQALAGATSVVAVMQPAPPSVRPSITAPELAKSMDRDARRYVLVTTSHGRLLGIVGRSDLHGQH